MNFADMVGIAKDERSMEEGRNWLRDRFLPFVEKQLSTNKYLAGPNFTLSDINLLTYLDLAEPSKIDLSIYPSLSAWRNNLKAQDFYTKCHKDFSDNLAALK